MQTLNLSDHVIQKLWYILKLQEQSLNQHGVEIAEDFLKYHEEKAHYSAV